MTMKSFKSFLSEAVEASKRQNMLHLQKMKDEEFVDWIRQIKSELNGKLENLRVSLKVDGGGGRFGKDSDGRPFFEGSRTGPIFEPKAFSTHAKSKGFEGENLLRAGHYDDMFEHITKSDFIKTLPNNCKVICEIMYNPMAEIDDDGVKFVTIKYDKSKLGSLMTIVPFKVVVASTGQEHSQGTEILKKLYSMSNDKIKFVDPNLKVSSHIDIAAFIDPIASLNQQSLEILKSRKAADKAAKENVKTIIQRVKDALALYILHHENIVDKFKLGKDIEGLVLNIGGQDIKITTAEFKASKAKEKQ